MKRKVTNAEVVQYIFDNTLGRVFTRIKTYQINPKMIGMDMNMWLHKLKYTFLKTIDPPPKRHEKESDDEYFDRIDPKYGLRYYEAMVSMGLGLNPETAIPHMEDEYKREKDRKIWKDLIMVMIEAEQKNKERYQKFLIRNEVLKNQS